MSTEPLGTCDRKHDLIEWIVDWRSKRGGSISEHNHRRILQTRTKAELEHLKRRIIEGEAGGIYR